MIMKADSEYKDLTSSNIDPDSLYVHSLYKDLNLNVFLRHEERSLLISSRKRFNQLIEICSNHSLSSTIKLINGLYSISDIFL